MVNSFFQFCALIYMTEGFSGIADDNTVLPDGINFTICGIAVKNVFKKNHVDSQLFIRYKLRNCFWFLPKTEIFLIAIYTI